MKNLEKIAIDSILQQFEESNKELIESAAVAKRNAEIAQHNFKKAASPLLNVAKESGNLLIQDEVSNEAIAYFETKMAEIIKIPFNLKKQ